MEFLNYYFITVVLQQLFYSVTKLNMLHCHIQCWDYASDLYSILSFKEKKTDKSKVKLFL